MKEEEQVDAPVNQLADEAKTEESHDSLVEVNDNDGHNNNIVDNAAPSESVEEDIALYLPYAELLVEPVWPRGSLVGVFGASTESGGNRQQRSSFSIFNTRRSRSSQRESESTSSSSRRLASRRKRGSQGGIVAGTSRPNRNASAPAMAARRNMDSSQPHQVKNGSPTRRRRYRVGNPRRNRSQRGDTNVDADDNTSSPTRQRGGWKGRARNNTDSPLRNFSLPLKIIASTFSRQSPQHHATTTTTEGVTTENNIDALPPPPLLGNPTV